MYDAYQNLLNGLDVMLQVCHGIPQQGEISSFSTDISNDDLNQNSQDNCSKASPNNQISKKMVLIKLFSIFLGLCQLSDTWFFFKIPFEKINKFMGILLYYVFQKLALENKVFFNVAGF